MLHNARCKVKTVNLPQSEQQLCIQGSVQLGTTLAQLGMKCCKTEAIKSIDLSCHFGKCFFPQKASSVPRPSNSRGNELRICFGYGSYGSSHGELPAEFPPLTGTFFSNPCRFFGDAFWVYLPCRPVGEPSIVHPTICSSDCILLGYVIQVVYFLKTSFIPFSTIFFMWEELQRGSAPHSHVHRICLFVWNQYPFPGPDFPGF